MSSRVWTTKTGERIPIVGLADGHLVNIARMLARAWPAICRHFGITCREDLYRIVNTDQADELVDVGQLATFLAIFDEAKRRGLDVADPGPGVGAGIVRPDPRDIFDEIDDVLALSPPTEEE